MLKANLKPFSDTSIKSLGKLPWRNAKCWFPNQFTNGKNTIRTNSFIYMKIFSQEALQNELYKLTVGMTLASENSPRPSQPRHIHWKPVGKHMVRVPNGPGLGMKNMSETVGRILISQSFRKQNHSTWLALLVPRVEPRTGWQITQTMNEVELFNKWLESTRTHTIL